MYKVWLSITTLYLIKPGDLHFCNQKQNETQCYGYISVYSQVPTQEKAFTDKWSSKVYLFLTSYFSTAHPSVWLRMPSYPFKNNIKVHNIIR